MESKLETVFLEMMNDLSKTILPAVEDLQKKKIDLKTRIANLEKEEQALTRENDQVALDIEREQEKIVDRIAVSGIDKTMAKKTRELKERSLEIPILIEGIKRALPSMREELKRVDEELWTQSYGPFRIVAEKYQDLYKNLSKEMIVINVAWEKAIDDFFATAGIRKGVHPWQMFESDAEKDAGVVRTLFVRAQANLNKSKGVDTSKVQYVQLVASE